MATSAFPLAVEDFQCLLLLTSLLQPLHDFISLFASDCFSPPEMQDFLKHLASLSSVCGWIQPSAKVHEVIWMYQRAEVLEIGQNIWKFSKKEALACLTLLVLWYVLSPELRNIIKLLAQCALRLFKGPSPYANNAVQSSSPDSFFPSLPIVRERGYYEADKETRIAGRNKCKKMSSATPLFCQGHLQNSVHTVSMRCHG